MSVTDNQAKCLARALMELAGPGGPGDISFVRCIPTDLIATACFSSCFSGTGLAGVRCNGGKQKCSENYHGG